MTDQRTRQLDKRFRDTLSGSVKLDERLNTSRLFLEGLCVQVDPVKCIEEIVSSPLGLDAVQKAMFSDLRSEFLNGLASDVLAYLLRANGVGGDMLSKVIVKIVEPPIFWREFCKAFEDSTLDQEAQQVFAAVLSFLLQMTNRNSTSYLQLASHPSILRKLLASDQYEIRAVGHLINHNLSTDSTAHTIADSEAPGGRHDNDFADFRKISIIPTADELLSKRRPALQPASVLNDPDGNETRVVDYLDNMFRLLREDMVHVLREELEIVLNKKQGRHRGLVVGVELVGAYTGHENWKTPWSFLLECAYDYPIFTNIKYDDSLVNDPYRSAAESLGLRHYKRRCFLTHDPCGSKLLRHQTFACLIADGTFVCLGTIHRDTYQLALEPPTIILQIEDQDSVPRTLLQLKAASDVRLVQIDSPLFAFEPVLKALQKMRFLPLSEEILFWENGKKIKRPLVPVPEITCKLTQDPSIDIQLLFDTPRSVNLDSSQVRSLLAGLNQKVSLIQGPPGTGKSFIGALIAKALYKYTKQTILVVCYTNHALDQFLEDLIAIGVEREDIVRFGGRPKTSVEDLSIKNIKRERLLYAESWNELTSVANGYGDKLVKSFEKFISSDTNFSSILSHIKFKDPKFFAAFQVPIPEHGMFTVGPLGKLVDPTFLISRWAQGKSPSLFKDEPNVRDAAHIWNMETCHRQQKLESWRISVTAGIADDIRIAGQRYNRCQANMKSISRGYLPLSGKRIIGCTTTGAAKFTEDINDISPDVLLVEEAGEILESHVITALSSSTTQMILIGDHKQLRPKVNNYALTIEKGDGYDLNRSLFERLILKGFPHVTLSTQHRMRPEISSLIRELTYPDLVDAPGTQNRENIRGVQSNVIFVDHNHPEDDDERIFDRGDGGSPTSKRNTFEVDMVLRMVRYLTHQGYESKNIVVLTPYLGQLSMLRDALKDERDTILNDLDLNALLLHGLWHTDTMKKKDRIQLVTIDNYQGEESDIVIASLCRSNASNDIGFMHSPERLNVLISRARNGLILIGNSSTFERSKKGGTLWSRFFDLLRKGGHFYKGFPVKCEKHPNWMGRVMEKFDDFDISPTGGCTEPCGILLGCGIHKCPLKCHLVSIDPNRLDDHPIMLCKAPLRDTCPAGIHQMTWKCYKGRPSKCEQCENERKRLEKQAKLDLDAKEKREAVEREHDIRMAELEAVLQCETKLLSDIQKGERGEAGTCQEDTEEMEERVEQVAPMAATSSNETLPSPVASGSPLLSSPLIALPQNQPSDLNNTPPYQIHSSRSKWGFQTQSNSLLPQQPLSSWRNCASNSFPSSSQHLRGSWRNHISNASSLSQWSMDSWRNRTSHLARPTGWPTNSWRNRTSKSPSTSSQTSPDSQSDRSSPPT